jgi:hypothetical protein
MLPLKKSVKQLLDTCALVPLSCEYDSPHQTFEIPEFQISITINRLMFCPIPVVVEENKLNCFLGDLEEILQPQTRRPYRTRYDLQDLVQLNDTLYDLEVYIDNYCEDNRTPPSIEEGRIIPDLAYRDTPSRGAQRSDSGLGGGYYSAYLYCEFSLQIMIFGSYSCGI